MDKVIYVYPNGEAAALDELHSLALLYDHNENHPILNFYDRLGDALRAMAFHAFGIASDMVSDVLRMVRDLWGGLKEIAESFRVLFETAKETRKENYRQWQQRNQRRKNHSIMKMYLQNKIQKPTDAARFNRARRRL